MTLGRIFGRRFARLAVSNRLRRAIRAVAEPLERRMFLDAQVNFAAHVDYPTGGHSRSVTTADFNGDGRLDLATANLSDTISVLLGNGDGTFAAKTDFPTGKSPYSVAAADFNGDGRIDLATANYGGNSVSVLLNNGDGTFAANVDYPAGTKTGSLAAADLNGDGAIDIVATNQDSNTISVYLNTGDGTFAAKADYSTGTSPNSVAVGDFNGDGSPDLVVSNYGSSNVTVLLNSGEGSFELKTDYSVGSQPRSVAAADLNSDGKVDLAIAGSIWDTYIYFNNGDGTFGNRTTYSWVGVSICAADLNGDGNVDLLAADQSYGTANVLLGQGGGKFGTVAKFAASSGAMPIVGGDFDNDGRIDLAVAHLYSNSTIGILLNIGDTDLAPTDISLSCNAVPELQPAGTFVGGFGTTHPDAALPITYTLVSGPGGDDNAAFTLSGSMLNTASVFISQNKSSYSIRVRSTDRGGLFVERVFAISVLRTAAFAGGTDYGTGITPQAVTTADFNGDGKIDIAVVNAGSNTVRVLQNRGDGTFALSPRYSTGAGPFGVSAGDLNGDGKPDLAVANHLDNTISVLLNNGDGTFAPKVDYVTGEWPQRIAIADYNGDGKADLAVTGSVEKLP